MIWYYFAKDINTNKLVWYDSFNNVCKLVPQKYYYDYKHILWCSPTALKNFLSKHFNVGNKFRIYETNSLLNLKNKSDWGIFEVKYERNMHNIEPEDIKSIKVYLCPICKKEFYYKDSALLCDHMF